MVMYISYLSVPETPARGAELARLDVSLVLAWAWTVMLLIYFHHGPKHLGIATAFKCLSLNMNKINVKCTEYEEVQNIHEEGVIVRLFPHQISKMNLNQKNMTGDTGKTFLTCVQWPLVIKK